MFLKLFFNLFRNGGPCPGILVLVLGIMTGPALGQDGWGLASQPEVAALSAVLMNPAIGESCSPRNRICACHPPARPRC